VRPSRPALLIATTSTFDRGAGLQIVARRPSFDYHLTMFIPWPAFRPKKGQSGSALPPGSSDIHLLSDGEGVVNLDAEISDCTFNFGVA
jgi:hypothetical protein